MAQPTYFTVEQERHMRAAGLNYKDYELVSDLSKSMLIRNKNTGQVTLVKKTKNPKRLGN